MGSRMPCPLGSVQRRAATTSCMLQRQTSLPRPRRVFWTARVWGRGSLAVVCVFERFTERSIKAVMISQKEAKNMGCSEVHSEHILLGLVGEAEQSSIAQRGYLGSGLSVDRVKAVVEQLAAGAQHRSGRASGSDTGTLPFSRDSRKIFLQANNECKKAGVNFINPEHIALAMCTVTERSVQHLFDSLGVDCHVLKYEAQKRLKGDQEEAEQPSRRKIAKDGPQVLEDFCKDLCAEVRAGRIDPVIGRDREVARVTQILARRTKNNPILLGEPGVGKTAIAEGLARCIVNRTNPDGTPLAQFLHAKRVMQLDVGRIISGAKERGELEKRVTKLVQEVKDAGNVILMIDEVHMLVGAGSAGRGVGLDISNLLKPALARGEFQVMGATTIAEHRKYIERDAALERRFQPVYVDEPSPEQTLDIIKGLRERYERHHRVVYSEEALQAAVTLSHKYIADRRLPDKAIDLMDEAGSRVRIQSYTARKEFNTPENPMLHEYLQVLDAKSEVLKDSLFEEAGLLQRREGEYRVELSGSAAAGSSLPLVGSEDIEAVVAAWTNIPVERMSQDEKAKLLQLAAVLKGRLIGQDDAVDAVSAALLRARCGLQDPRRPIASLLLVGPTGVGKTELAKVLAEQYFGSRDAMVRLDMSEYMERHSVSKLIGSPPGYLGYGDGGKLTEAVRRRPCSIVLFDEIEKAHPEVFSLLLQILEDGRLTDSQGRTVSFKNAMVLLTSNIGSRTIAGMGGGTGFSALSRGAESQAATHQSQVKLNRLVLEEVKQFFKPELLNRFDEQVVFQRLSRADVTTIASLMMKETEARVVAKGYRLVVSPQVMSAVISEGFSDEYGVRPLRNTIVRFVDDPLSDALLNGQIPLGSTLEVDLDRKGQPIVTDHLGLITVADHASGFGGAVRIFMNNRDMGAPRFEGPSLLRAEEVVHVEP